MLTSLNLVFHNVKLPRPFLFIMLHHNICSMPQWFMSLWNVYIAMVPKASERLRRWISGIWEGHDNPFMVPGQMKGMYVHRISYHLKEGFAKTRLLSHPPFSSSLSYDSLSILWDCWRCAPNKEDKILVSL